MTTATGGYEALLADLRQYMAAEAEGGQRNAPGARPNEMRAQQADGERLLVRSFPGRTRPAPAPPPPPARKQLVVVRAPTPQQTLAKALDNRDDIMAKAMAAFHAGHLSVQQVSTLEHLTNERLSQLADRLPA